jgi:phage-related tail protein
MPSEALQLIAQVTDRFSAPMRDMQRQLSLFDEKGRKVHTEGVKAARLHAQQYAELQKQTKETARTVKELLTPTLAVLGVGAISAGAAMAGLTKSILDFGESAKQLKFLREETGLTIDQLRQFHGIASIIGTTNEALDAGFRKAKAIQDEWQRWHTGPVLDWAAKLHDMPGLGEGGAKRLRDFAESNVQRNFSGIYRRHYCDGRSNLERSRTPQFPVDVGFRP